MQADLIANSLEQAEVDPRTINYVEVAANGSALGDAIEIAGLTKAFQRLTLDRQFCAIGAVKSNLGHLEAASGMAQLTKVLLQLKHELLVPSINAEPLNPNLQLDSTPFYVQQRLSHWERIRIPEQGQFVEMPRRATISSFGAGGSNAHIVVEEYQSPESGFAVETPGGTAAGGLISEDRRKPERLLVWRLLAFLQDEITPAAPLPIEAESLHSLCEDLLAISAAILDVPKDDIDIERDLDEYGFEASHYTALAHRLRDRYGIELSGRTLLDTRSLERIAQYLVSHHRPAPKMQPLLISRIRYKPVANRCANAWRWLSPVRLRWRISWTNTAEAP